MNGKISYKELKQQLEELKKKYDGLKKTKEYESRSFQVRREPLSIAEFQQLRNQHPVAMDQHAYQLNDENTANYKMYFGDMEGNLVETLYFVPSIFTVTKQTVESYVDGLDGRLTSMECVINALQFLGVFDAYTANMLRMTNVASNEGYNRKQMEMTLMLWDIFVTRTNYNEYSRYETVADDSGNILPHLFDLVKVGNFDVWANYINKIFRGTVNHHEYYAANGPVDGNPALLCWWSEASKGHAHAFVMLKNSDNQLVVIDPMLRKPWCNFYECLAMFTENAADDRVYHVVANSVTRLTDSRQLEYFGFKIDPSVRQTPFKQMIRIIDLDYQDEHIGTSGCGDRKCSAADALLSLNQGNENEDNAFPVVHDAEMDANNESDDYDL